MSSCHENCFSASRCSRRSCDCKHQLPLGPTNMRHQCCGSKHLLARPTLHKGQHVRTFLLQPGISLIYTRCQANARNELFTGKSLHRRAPIRNEKRQKAKYSTDGTCGPANGNTLCDPKSTVYTGSCCSQYGWVCLHMSAQAASF